MTDRRRWAMVSGLVLGSVAVGLVTRDGLLPDFQLFATAGDDVLTGRWSQVYEYPLLQAGPVILVLSAILAHIGGAATVFVAGLPVVSLLAYVGTGRLRAALGLDRRPLVQCAAAAALLLWEAGAGGVHSGHLSQLIVPALWLAAAVAARHDRVVPAGALLAVGAGCEVWGVLAVPVLLLAPRPARRLHGCLALAGGIAVMYLPFALSGTFRMFDFAWLVSSETLYRQLFPASFPDGFPWWARCLQAGLATAACAAVVLLRRRDVAVVWAAPLAAVLVRLVLDPVGMYYYWTAAVVLLIAAAATAPPARAAVAVLLCWWQFLPPGRIWSGTALVSLPALLLLLLLLPDPDQDAIGSSSWLSDDIPGMSRMFGARWSSQASATDIGVAPSLPATEVSVSDWSGEKPPSRKYGT